MPERILRPGILSSDAVNKLSWPEEVFYRRLMSVVDDYGRFDGRNSVIRASIYPLKLDHVSDSDIGKWKAVCATAGLVRVYFVDGKEFIELLKFNQRMRGKARWPEPVDSESQKSAASRGEIPLSSEAQAQAQAQSEAQAETEKSASLLSGKPDGKVLEPQEKPGRAANPYPAGLLKFWQSLPPKGRDRSSRKKCLAPWKSHKCEQHFDLVMAGLDRWKQSAKWTASDGQFVENAHGWLRNRKWEESPELSQKDLEYRVCDNGFIAKNLTEAQADWALGETEGEP
jgi:hypothetical protein